MEFYVCSGNNKELLTPGVEFPIRRKGEVIARLKVAQDRPNQVRVTILDVGNLTVRSGPGFAYSCDTNTTLDGDFLLQHHPKDSPELIVAVIHFKVPLGELDFTYA